MAEHVDEARSHSQSFCIHFCFTDGVGKVAYHSNRISVNSHVSGNAWFAGTVIDSSSADDDIVFLLFARNGREYEQDDQKLLHGFGFDGLVSNQKSPFNTRGNGWAAKVIQGRIAYIRKSTSKSPLYAQGLTGWSSAHFLHIG